MRHNRKVKLKLQKAMKLGYLAPPWPYWRYGRGYPDYSYVPEKRTHMLSKKQQAAIIADFIRRRGKFEPWKGWKRFYGSSNRKYHCECRVCRGYGTEDKHYYDEETWEIRYSPTCSACNGATYSKKAYQYRDPA